MTYAILITEMHLSQIESGFFLRYKSMNEESTSAFGEVGAFTFSFRQYTSMLGGNERAKHSENDGLGEFHSCT